MAVVPFRAPARRRLHEDVAEQLRDAILDGRFATGSKLPPERDLAAEFRVNRTSVREAIKVLRTAEKKFGFNLEITEAPVGWAGIDAAGKALPDDTLALCKQSDAILFGSVGLPDRPARGPCHGCALRERAMAPRARP